MISFKDYLITEEMISEGGSSGHMSHLYDEIDMTFGELKQLIKDVLSGKIELHEKTDGQQLGVTFKDNQLMAARNKTTLKDPMSIEEVAKKFAGRGAIKDAFVNSMRDVQSAVMSLSQKDRVKIFNDGHNFMAFEIIYPPTKNVVNYGNKALIQFHGVNLYDANWKKTGEDKSLAKKLYSMLKAKGALNQEVFTITGPAVLSLAKDYSKEIPIYIKELSKIQGSIKDGQTIADWIKDKWIDILSNEQFNEETEMFKDNFIQRWGFYDKSYKKCAMVKDVLVQLPADQHDDFKVWFNQMDAENADINKKILRPLELFTIRLGGELLNNVKGLITANPDMTVSDMRKDLDDAIKTIKASDIESAAKKLEQNLSKIEAVGFDKIAPAEGLVLMYKGKPLKLTGIYGSVNQLIGMFKYGRL